MINLVEKLRDAGLEPRSYSGRGMYGKQCVGVEGEHRELTRALNSVVEDCLQEAFDRGAEEEGKRIDEEITHKEQEEYEYPPLEEIQKFVKSLLDYKADQMGLGQIYYWPSIEWKEEEEDNG